MKKFLCIALLFLPACGFDELWKSAEADSNSQTSPTPTPAPSSKYYLSLGDVAPEQNDLILSQPVAASRLQFTADPAIVSFQIHDNGALLTPLAVGMATIRYTIDGLLQNETFQAIIPPQTFIQILVAEAQGQLFAEATKENDRVVLTSKSITGEGIGAVIKNRIALIVAQNRPALFNADEVLFDLNPPQSHYDAVIEAPNQFQPVNPADSNNDVYRDGIKRSNFSGIRSLLIAYDQAVLTAAQVFSGEASDPTNGAFAFRSPNTTQWTTIQNGLQSQTKTLPAGIGVSDATFPALAPIQVFVHPQMDKVDTDNRPAFIFSRSRDPNEVAITDQP